jgi:uncharacterized membrane protein
MKQLITLGVVFLIIAFILFACSKGSSGGGGNTNVDCSIVPKTYSADVSPIISTRCAITGCHAAGSVNGPGELITYQEIFNARSNIRSAVSSGLMPQGSSLTQSQKNSITCWIDNGAANN